MSTNETFNSSMWTREQDKAFENALAVYSEDSSDRWEKITAAVPGKKLEEIKHHYNLLIEDTNAIESGMVPLPSYVSSFNDSTYHAGHVGVGREGSQLQQMQSDSNHGGKSSRSDQERRKGIAWTEEEHRSFLMGLERCGKGDWKSISRNFVLSRTPTQVASHAQKYFIRLNSRNKERRRSSIHDITSLDDGVTSVPQGPITGQPSVAAVGLPCGSGKPPTLVLSRTPSQVASHAQKYFIHLNSGNKEREQSSIHDITNLDDGGTSAPQGPVTGQQSGAAAGLPRGSGRPPPFVLSRTPTQVASHAQKYFTCLNSGNKGRGGSSIHDITSLNYEGTFAPQWPITGQMSGAAAGLPGGSRKALLSYAPDVGVHVPPTIDRSIHKSLISAVGTPVNLSYLEQMVYGVGASTSGSLVPAATTNKAPVTLDSFGRGNFNWFHP